MLKKQYDPKSDEFIMKVDVEHFGCNNLLQDFKFMKNVVKVVMYAWWNSRRKKNVYKKERFIAVYSVFLFLKILLLSRGLMFEISWVSKRYNGRW